MRRRGSEEGAPRGSDEQAAIMVCPAVSSVLNKKDDESLCQSDRELSGVDHGRRCPASR